MQSNEVIKQSQVSRREHMSQVSLNNGYWFYFDHEGNDISMWGSVFNGKEKVSFNNEVVSSFRNLSSTKSEHAFTKNGHEYLVKTHMTHVLRGELNVTLFCDGKEVASETLSQLEKGNLLKSFFSMDKLLFVGLIVGFLCGYLGFMSFSG